MIAGLMLISFIASVVFMGCESRARVRASHPDPMVELGRSLFYDNNLSINRTRSCGTCHNPDYAFTDGYKRSLGAYADLHQRNTQSLFNLGEQLYLTSADSSLHDVYDQMDQPLFNRHPIEMGADITDSLVLHRIWDNPAYVKLLEKVFPASEGKYTWHHIKMAIRAFVYTLQSTSSRWDAWKFGQATLTQEEQRGMHLFFGTRLKCGTCHGGKHFNTPTLFDSAGRTRFYFNIGLYNLDATGAYPTYDQGLFQRTKNPTDMGAFRVPTLRNLSFTAPYFHDGSAATLEDVVDMYAAGGRHIETGEWAGDGRLNPHKDRLIAGFSWTAAERRQLLAFLRTLDDTVAMQNPYYRPTQPTPLQK